MEIAYWIQLFLEKLLVAKRARLAKEVGDRGKTREPSSSLRLNVNNQEGYENYGIFIFKKPIKFLKEIQELMNHDAGIIRDETRFKHGLKRILELKEEFYSKDNFLKDFKIDDYGNSENVVLTWEVKSSLVVCEAIYKKCPDATRE